MESIERECRRVNIPTRRKKTYVCEQ
uniref:Uncharacterized protein n=1 Tax=Lepeophtheirus salmonis TaxID=72036 RepID=A0A0K2VHA3_LEPSM